MSEMFTRRPADADRIDGERLLSCGCRATGYGKQLRWTHRCAVGEQIQTKITAATAFGIDRRILDAALAAQSEHLSMYSVNARPWPLEREQTQPPKPLKDGLDRSDVTSCRACGAAIVFLKHPGTNRPHPMDAATVSKADIFWERGKGQVSHFKTCPNADQFRKDPAQ